MKILQILTLLVIFSGTVSAGIHHEIDLGEDVEVKTVLGLESDQPVNSWNVNYRIPENSQITEARDTQGELELSSEGPELSFETNSGPSRTEEQVNLTYEVKQTVENRSGLKTYSLSFSGFENRKTTGEVTAEEVLSWSFSRGFDASKNDDLRFKGEGPVNIAVNTGRGEESEYYSFFGGENLTDADEAFEISLGSVGFEPGFEKYPVVVGEGMREEWVSGEYTNGKILLASGSEEPVLAHETVHAMNHQLLGWDRTNSAWFDEGVARHVEDLVRTKNEGRERTPELFGEEVSYREDDKVYTLPSRGDREELRNYYQNDEDFMKHWSPEKGNREFGYAYSELIIKYHLKNNQSLEEVYTEIDPSQPISENQEKWEIYSEEMELEPCNSGNREQFEACLDDINNHEFEIVRAEPTEEDEELELIEVEPPEVEEPDTHSFWLALDRMLYEILEVLR